VTLYQFLGTLVASTDILNKLIDLLAVDIVVETLGRGVCEPLGRLGGAIYTPRREVESTDRTQTGCTPHKRYLVNGFPS
jgi:hypothetical protein